MANIVFILGAGASADSGCPVMNNFMPRMRRLYEMGYLNEFRDDYESLTSAKQELERAGWKVSFDHSHMEKLFSALEMANNLGRLGSLNSAQIESALRAFMRLTAATIELTQEFGTGAEEGPPKGFMPAASYDQISTFTSSFVKNRECNSANFITFNYDPGLEIALHLRQVPAISDPISFMGSNAGAQVKVHKLHGSVLWLPRADGPPSSLLTTVTSNIDEAKSQLRSGRGHEHLGGIRPESHFNQATKWRVTAVRDWLVSDKGASPFLVPPTDSKSKFRESMLPIWQSAGAALASADVIVVAGYSLPATDVFFECLWAVAASSPSRIKKIYTIDRNSDIKHKIAGMVSSSLAKRVQHLDGNITNGIVSLQRIHDDTYGQWLTDGED